jgi:recombination protein RecT
MSTSQALKAVATGKPQKAEKPTTIQGFLDTYKGEIQRALPRHMTADRMARIALTEFRKNPALLKCEPASLFGAVIQCAQLGLEPGGALGHAYLIPFENRKKGITEVQFIVGYRGMIDLARRSGQIVSLEAHAVYEGDQFECEFGLESTLKHVPDWQNENRTKDDKLKFVYAVAKLKDGGTQFEVMSRAEIIAIRARSRAASSGPWVTDFPAMALKTVIRRLFKYLPVSVEMQQAVGLDEQVEAGLSQDNGAVIDSSFSVVDDEPQGDVTLDTSPVPEGPVTAQMNGLTFAQVADKLEKADGLDVLDVAFDLVSAVADEQQRGELKAIYERRKAELSGQ